MLTLITIILITAFLYFWYWMIVEGKNVKMQYHADNNFTSHRNSDHLRDDSNCAPCLSVVRPVSESSQEEKLFAILKKIPATGEYTKVIKRIALSGTQRERGLLISELKDQLQKAPKALQNYIGTNGIEILKTI